MPKAPITGRRRGGVAAGTRSTLVPPKGGAANRIADLGWTRKRAAQVRASLAAFEEDWNAPGMEEYDKL